MNLSPFLAHSLFALPASNFQEALLLLFALVITHALADFPLQGEFISTFKNRHCKPDPEKCPQFPSNLWVYCLSAHALIHAGFVWLLTGSALLGAVELVVHWITDFAKCEKWTTFNVDQMLHLVTRIVYVGLIWAGIVS